MVHYDTLDTSYQLIYSVSDLKRRFIMKLNKLFVAGAALLTTSATLMSCSDGCSRKAAEDFITSHYTKTESKTCSMHAKWNFADSFDKPLAQVQFLLILVTYIPDTTNPILYGDRDVMITGLAYKPVTVQELPKEEGDKYASYRYYTNNNALSIKRMYDKKVDQIIDKHFYKYDYDTEGYITKIHVEYEKLKLGDEAETKGFLEINYTYLS